VCVMCVSVSIYVYMLSTSSDLKYSSFVIGSSIFNLISCLSEELHLYSFVRKKSSVTHYPLLEDTAVDLR
jgi:hypothetical protein